MDDSGQRTQYLQRKVQHLADQQKQLEGQVQSSLEKLEKQAVELRAINVNYDTVGRCRDLLTHFQEQAHLFGAEQCMVDCFNAALQILTNQSKQRREKTDNVQFCSTIVVEELSSE